MKKKKKRIEKQTQVSSTARHNKCSSLGDDEVVGTKKTLEREREKDEKTHSLRGESSERSQ